MPFLAIFRKDKDKDASRSKSTTPIPPSPSVSKKSSSFSRSRSRPSFASTRSCISPPPQLANISPQSDLDYVLPELDDPSLVNVLSPARPTYMLGGDLQEMKSAPSAMGVSASTNMNTGASASAIASPSGANSGEAKQRRGLPFGRRRGSASSGLITASASTPPVTAAVRPFSEALDTFMTRKEEEERNRDLDLGKVRDTEPPATPTPTPTPPHTNSEKNSNGNAHPNTTRQTPNKAPLEDIDSDDDPLLPPPTRASVFGGYAYSDSDRSPSRTQSLPDEELARKTERPPRPQVHPHQMGRGKNKSVDLSTLLTSSAPSPTSPLPTSVSTPAASEKEKDKKKGKDSNSSTKTGGIFTWRSKSSKDVTAPSPTTVVIPAVPPVADPADSSFSLKSFRHVGPASVPASPILHGSATGSTSNINLPGVNTGLTAAVVANTPPSSFTRATSPTARPVPGRTGVTRERVNSTGSESVMTAGLFRQAARRSSTNLVEDGGVGVSTSPRSSAFRDREHRGPPTRAWDAGGGSGSVSSGSEKPPARPSRNARPPGSGNGSDRGELGLGKPSRSVGRSSSAMPYVGGARAESPASSPESPFAIALSQLGGEGSFGGARSDYGGYSAQSDYGAAGARSDGGRRIAAQVPSTSLSGWGARSDGGMRSVSARPGPQPVSSNSRPGPQPASNSRLGSQPPSPTKPRQSAPTAMNRPPVTRSPMRSTIPTKTNDGPSIKPRASSPTKMGRSSPTKSPGSSPNMSRSDAFVQGRRPSGDSSMSHSRFASVDTARAKSPPFEHRGKSPSVDVLRTRPSAAEAQRSKTSGFEVIRSKSPGFEVNRAKSPSFEANRAKLSGFEVIRPKPPGTNASAPEAKPTPRTGYKPPPRQSSLAIPAGMVDSDSDESEPEVDSGSEELGFGSHSKGSASKPLEKERVGGTDSFGARVAANAAGPEAGALRGRGTNVFPQRNSGSGSGSGHGHDGPTNTMLGRDGLTRERTITQRTAGSERTSPHPPPPPPKVGVSLFDRPTPSFDKSSSSSTSGSPFERPGASLDKFGTPPPRTVSRSRASHSTSAITAAATARNSAALAEANRSMAGRPSHVRAPATVEGTDTDEDDDDKSESDSDDNAPLSSLAAPRRPGSAASVAAPSMSRTPLRTARTQPLIDMSNVAPPPRPPRRVAGVGVTRNSSLRGSRSVEDLGRMTTAPVPTVGGRPGPRPFAASPPSSTGDSSSGKAPLTPRDGSEAGGRRIGSSLGPAGDEARRKARRRGEAKASVELGNVINGPGPLEHDDDDEEMSAHHSQGGHGGMGMLGQGMGMGWNQPGMFPSQSMGYGGFPASQSMPFAGSQMPNLQMQFTGSQTMPFIPPPPPPGAPEAYIMAHQQAVMIAKQAYLSAVAQQAMAAATEQWERSSTIGGGGGGSVYGGSQMSMNRGMPMMGGMGMYANSSYAASVYEGSVAGGGGWGSASAYGGPSPGRNAYGGGGGAKSEYGGGMRSSPTKGTSGNRAYSGEPSNRNRTKPRSSSTDAPAPPQHSSNRGNPIPPSTWSRRKAGL